MEKIENNEEIKSVLEDIMRQINYNLAHRTLDLQKGIYINNDIDDEDISIDNYVFDGVTSEYSAMICSRKVRPILFHVKDNKITEFCTTMEDHEVLGRLRKTLENTNF